MLDHRLPLINFHLVVGAQGFGGLLLARRDFLAEVGEFLADAGIGQRLYDRRIDFISGYVRPHAYELAGKKISGRVILLHVVVVLGDGIALALHSPVAALVMLGVLKPAGDLINERRR